MPVSLPAPEALLLLIVLASTVNWLSFLAAIPAPWPQPSTWHVAALPSIALSTITTDAPEAAMPPP